MTSPWASGRKLGMYYYGFRVGGWLAEHAPRFIAYPVAHLGGRIAYKKAHGKRSTVRKNLARLVGEGPELDDVVKAAFLSYSEYWLETFRLGRYKAGDLLEMVDPVGDSEKVVAEAMAEGKGILVLTPHFGFYDIGVAWVAAKGWPATTVAEVLRPKALFEWFASIRERHGTSVLPARNAKWVREKLSVVLDEGQMVALVADRDLGRRGTWVEYLGERTTFPTTPAILIVEKQVPMIGAAISRNGKHFDMYFERFDYSLTGDRDADVAAVAQVIATGLGRLVRRAPEQYHLFSTNWPSDEAHLLPRGRRSDRQPAAHGEAAARPEPVPSSKPAGKNEPAAHGEAAARPEPVPSSKPAGKNEPAAHGEAAARPEPVPSSKPAGKNEPAAHGEAAASGEPVVPSQPAGKDEPAQSSEPETSAE